VREPAEGFWIAGSSIKDMNGVYKKVERVGAMPTLKLMTGQTKKKLMRKDKKKCNPVVSLILK
jgi:hypothetical protein